MRIALAASQQTLKAKAVPAKTIQLDSGTGATQGTHFPGFTLDPDADPGPAVEAVGIAALARGVASVPGKPSRDLSDLGANASSLLDECNGTVAPLMV